MRAIQEAAVLLKASQQVACTGQVLLHRFYAKRSMVKFDVRRVAATSVFLACKLEECPRKLRDVVNVFHRMSRRREKKPLTHLEYFSKRYEDIKADLVRVERHMLREFGFCIHAEHPHKFVLNYLRMMGQDSAMMNAAWKIANDLAANHAVHTVQGVQGGGGVHLPRRQEAARGAPRGSAVVGPVRRHQGTDRDDVRERAGRVRAGQDGVRRDGSGAASGCHVTDETQHCRGTHREPIGTRRTY